MLDAPLLVLVDLETTEAAPTGPSLELLTAARDLTGGDVVALALQPLGEAASAALAGAGATRLLSADLGEAAHRRPWAPSSPPRSWSSPTTAARS